MSNFAVSVPFYLHISHGNEDTIKDCLIGGKIIEFDGSMFDLIQKVKNMLLIKNIETVVFNDELHMSNFAVSVPFYLHIFGKKIIMALNMTLN